MESVFDRVRQELDQIGDRVASAIETGRLQVEKVRLTSVRKDVAAELGLLVHGRERDTPADDARYDALLERLDDLQAQITRVERELAAERGEGVTVSEEPPPPAEPAEGAGQEPTPGS